ncbi:Copper transport protein ctr4 [Cytospora mali]|uniref:Copper transport protein n=1 Tax=Cytospora mali TaxID=578113 RepID=A0A194VZ17_CYTMA|nr:Copper transport protein ctr4 [Valsa mali]
MMDMEMSSSMATCNTSMLWNWYTIDSCFLAESWHVSSQGAFAASCIGTILLVMVLEALRRFGREYDDWILRGFQARAATLSDCSSSRNNGSVAKVGFETTVSAARVDGRLVVFRASPLQQVIRSVIHAVSLGVAYIVMLLVMSYNGYIIICVIIGGGLGKFFFDWMTKRVLIDASDTTDMGGEENSAGIEEPSMCCG